MTQQQPKITSLLYFIGAAAVAGALFAATLSPLAAQGINEAVKSAASSASTSVRTGVVTSDDTRLNVRAGPGVDYEVVAKLDPGDSVQILNLSDDGAWYEIRVPGASEDGWVTSEFVGVDASVEQTRDPALARARTTVTSELEQNLQVVTASVETLVLLPTPTPTPSSQTIDAPAASASAPVSAGAPADELADGAAAPTIAAEVGSIPVSPSFTPRVSPTRRFVTFTSAMTSTESIAESEALSGDGGVEEPAAAELAVSQDVTGTASAASADTGATRVASQTVPAAVVPLAVTTPTADADDGAASTPAVEPTAVPQPTPSVPVAVTEPDSMNVRSGPGTNYDVVASVSAGTELEILALGPSGEWYQVRLDGREEPAWLFAGLAKGLGPMEGLARVAESDVPPPPTPAPQAPSAAAASVSAAPPPSGAGFFGYGVQAHLLGGQAGSALTSISDLGFNWVKQQVEWRLFQPQAGAIGFGELGGIVSSAGNRGINVLFSVVNAPQWAREPGFDSSVGGPPADPQTYANFVGGMAGEFCGTSLKAIEIWNEQNLHYEWGNKPLDPAEYMNLLKAAYTSIKAACPEMLVISGALTPAGSNPPFAMDDFAYLEQMYQQGLASYADGIGAHPSGYNVPANVRWEEACSVIQQTGNSFNGACDTPHHSWAFRSTMEGYRNIMNVYGDSNKRIWPTEFGWAAGGAFDPRYAYANDNSFDEQAQWTVEAYQMMKAWGWVGPAFLWNLNFRVVADGTEKAQWGIVGNDYQPLPVYQSLKAMPK